LKLIFAAFHLLEDTRRYDSANINMKVVVLEEVKKTWWLAPKIPPTAT
jgi:hypothetical protein